MQVEWSRFACLLTIELDTIRTTLTGRTKELHQDHNSEAAQLLQFVHTTLLSPCIITDQDHFHMPLYQWLQRQHYLEGLRIGRPFQNLSMQSTLTVSVQSAPVKVYHPREVGATPRNFNLLRLVILVAHYQPGYCIRVTTLLVYLDHLITVFISAEYPNTLVSQNLNLQ